jgi:hypothetical protein
MQQGEQLFQLHPHKNLRRFALPSAYMKGMYAEIPLNAQQLPTKHV